MAPNQPAIPENQGRDRPRRIETQIHRRKKAKALSALESEWDQVGQTPPSHLRLPSSRMASTPPNKRKVPLE